MNSLLTALDWVHWPSKISPVLFRLGPFALRWYSLMYVGALATAYVLARARLKREPSFFSPEAFEEFIPWLVGGVVVGARLGYVLFYDFGYYLHRPWEIVLPFRWDGGLVFTGIQGLSYHGGFLGGLLAGVLFCRRRGLNPWRLGDLLAGVVPAGYTFGRIGNFLNGELFGRATTVPWGMYFPMDPSGLLRHPSQLYEAALEGAFLFGAMSFLGRKGLRDGVLSGAYVAGYGAVRFFLERFREPDVQIGFLAGGFTMGQFLCAAMVAGGATLIFVRRRKEP